MRPVGIWAAQLELTKNTVRPSFELSSRFDRGWLVRGWPRTDDGVALVF